MTICRFYQQGRCRFGENCKFEHPGAGRKPPNENRYSTFQDPPRNATSNPPRTFSAGRTSNSQHEIPYNLHPDAIKYDLTDDRPQWPLSAYGPTRSAPVQLFGGEPLEQSPEEMRVLHYLALAAGHPEQSIRLEQELYEQVQRQITNVLNDVNGAIRYIVDGANTHPNREDICAASTQQQNQAPWARGLNTATTFEHPSATASTFQRSPFAATGFGRLNSSPLAQQPPFAEASQFGQPTPLQGQGSLFGKPSVPGQALGFGHLPALSQSSPFGQAIGQTQNQPSPFGNPSGGSAQPSAFSQSSALDQIGGSISPFGQAAVQTSNSGTASVYKQAPERAATAFAAQPSTQPSTLGSFAETSRRQPFGGFPSPAANSPFGQPANSSPSPVPQTTINGFGQQAPAASKGPSFEPSHLPGAPSQSHPPGHLLAVPGPDVNQYSTRDPSTQRLTSWKGKTVTYVKDEPCYRRDADGELQRIWFPNGPPPPNPYTEMPEDAYDEAVKEAYLYLRDNWAFKDGIMPEIPPKREWIRWDV